MDGLPPLPKSLSGLLNFSRESLSRAEATLGLRGNMAATANTTAANKPPPTTSSKTPPVASAVAPPTSSVQCSNAILTSSSNRPSKSAAAVMSEASLGTTASSSPSSASISPSTSVNATPSSSFSSGPTLKGAVNVTTKEKHQPTLNTNKPKIHPPSSTIANNRPQSNPSPFRPIQSPGLHTYQNVGSPVKPSPSNNSPLKKLEHSNSTASSRSTGSSISASSAASSSSSFSHSNEPLQPRNNIEASMIMMATSDTKESLESPSAVQAANFTVEALKIRQNELQQKKMESYQYVREEVDTNWIHEKLPPSLVMSMSMLKNGSFQTTDPLQMSQTGLPTPPPVITNLPNGAQLPSNRNSFVNGGGGSGSGGLDYKLATLRNEMVSLRQLDMKLLCQLWALNESLQDYKRTLEDEESQREVASILESHLEDDEDEDELTANDNNESSWHEDDSAKHSNGSSDNTTVNQLVVAEEEEGYIVPHDAKPRITTMPPPPGKGRIVIGPTNAPMASNDPATRRRLPNRPQMPIFPQGQRALPGTNHIYGNMTTSSAFPPTAFAPSTQPPPPQHGGQGLVTPNSAFLTNLANKRIMSGNVNNKR